MNWLVFKDHPDVKYLFVQSQHSDSPTYLAKLQDLITTYNRMTGRAIDLTLLQLTLMNMHRYMERGDVSGFAARDHRTFVDLFFYVFPMRKADFQKCCARAKKAMMPPIDRQEYVGARSDAGYVLTNAWYNADRKVTMSVEDDPNWWESGQWWVSDQ